ncbi:MAG: class I SAM-dependent methyltransferase, partial [Gammaproteobacteria bacterium]
MTDTVQAGIKDIGKTSIWTLRARSEEHLQPHALFRDDKAIEWIRQVPWPVELNEWYSPRAQMGISIRTRVFDDLVQKHLQIVDRPLVVELGCGVSSRYHRIGKGRCQWLDFDLPDVIEVRRRLDPETEEHRYLSGSLLDNDWMDAVESQRTGDVIFVAEGLLMYFEQSQILELLRKMGRRFPNAVFIFDTQGEKAKKINNKFTRLVNAPLKWVVREPADLGELPVTVLS